MPKLKSIDCWNSYKSALARFAPDDLTHLAPGAEQHEIEAVENLMSLKFPAELRYAYRLHNGLALSAKGKEHSLFLKQSWWPLDKVSELWKFNDETGRRWEDEDDDFISEMNPKVFNALHIKPIAFSKGWIPIASCSDFHHKWVCICLDLDPAPSGTRGQLIMVSGRGDDPLLMASGFNAWLLNIATSLETGDFTVDAASGNWKDNRVGIPIGRSFCPV
jgi:cell wall assembly regulator SMI1